jgi:heptosyltransferase-2
VNEVVTAQKSLVNNILVIGPSWVGDMVMAQSLFKLLQVRYPGGNIDVLAPQWSEPLLKRMPEVRHSILSPCKHGELKLKSRYLLARRLRKNAYDRAIVLPNSLKSALIPFWSKIPGRTGWRGEWRFGLLNDIRILDKKLLPLMIQRFMALGVNANEVMSLQLNNYYPQLAVESSQVQSALTKQGLEQPSKPLLVLCPGAEYGPAKRWPAKYFATLAKEVIAADWEVWLLGSNNDRLLADIIMKATKNRCIDLIGKTDLAAAIDLMSLASAVVTNDSGLMHIAAALNRPLVAIYGSSSPEFTPPLTENVRLLSLDLPCSPCFKRVCPLKHFNCMKQITPDQVLTALNGLT